MAVWAARVLHAMAAASSECKKACAWLHGVQLEAAGSAARLPGCQASRLESIQGASKAVDQVLALGLYQCKWLVQWSPSERPCSAESAWSSGEAQGSVALQPRHRRIWSEPAAEPHRVSA